MIIRYLDPQGFCLSFKSMSVAPGILVGVEFGAEVELSPLQRDSSPKP